MPPHRQCGAVSGNLKPPTVFDFMYSYLYDTNIYRSLTKSKGGKAIFNFNHSLDKSPILKKIASQKVLFKMTPFTLIEALGVAIPDPKIKLPEQNIVAQEKRDVIDFISQEAKLFYSIIPETKREYLLKKAEEQSRYTSFEAKEIENIFINLPLSSDTVGEYLNSCLLFDYVCKYPYPQKLEIEMMYTFFIPSFFITNPATSGLSKFRIIKKIWDTIYPKLYVKSDYPKDVLEQMSRSMKIKKHEDFVDCELIHMVCFGDYYDKGFRPVVAFTCDDSKVVLDRISIYKSMVEVFLNLLDEKANKSYRNIIKSWKQGIVVFCNFDGTFKEVIEVNQIHPYI